MGQSPHSPADPKGVGHHTPEDKKPSVGGNAGLDHTSTTVRGETVVKVSHNIVQFSVIVK
jgi:hypothetical protein